MSEQPKQDKQDTPRVLLLKERIKAIEYQRALERDKGTK